MEKTQEQFSAMTYIHVGRSAGAIPSTRGWRSL